MTDRQRHGGEPPHGTDGIVRRIGYLETLIDELREKERARAEREDAQKARETGARAAKRPFRRSPSGGGLCGGPRRGCPLRPPYFSRSRWPRRSGP